MMGGVPSTMPPVNQRTGLRLPAISAGSSSEEPAQTETTWVS